MASQHGWHPLLLSWCKQCQWELLLVCVRAWAGVPCLLFLLDVLWACLLGTQDLLGLPTAPEAKQGTAPAVPLHAAASPPLCEPQLSAHT